MYGFQGDYKSRRKIDLSGRRNQEDRDRLIKRNQDERRAREQERLRKQAAAKIQAFYRGRKIAAAWRDREREAWDRDSNAFLSNLSGDLETASVLVNLVRSFLFFYQPSRDVSREMCLCQTLSKKRRETGMMFIPFMYTDLYDTWKYQLKRVLCIFLQGVGWNAGLQQEKVGLVDFINMLQLAITASEYERLGPAVDGKTLAREMQDVLVKHELYENLRNYLLALEVDGKKHETIPGVMTLALQPLQRARSNDQILADFISRILTVPLLPCRIKGALDKLSLMPLPAVLLATSRMDFSSYSVEETSALLSNLAVIAYPSVPRMEQDIMLACLDTLRRLSSRIPTYMLTDESSAGSTTYTMQVEDEEIDDIMDLDERSTTAHATLKLDERVLRRIAKLFDAQHLASILSLDAGTDATSLLTITNFVVTLVVQWPMKKDEVLHNMLLHSPTRSIRSIWEAFRATGLFRKVKESQSVSHSIIMDQTYTKEWGMLVLMCELFNRVLLTTGDDEFFDNNKNLLSLAEVKEFSGFLRNVAFALYWNTTELNLEVTLEGGCVKLSYIRDVATKLLQQIHARDSRRPFMPLGHWLMTTEFDMPSFVKAAVSDEQVDAHDFNQKDKRQGSRHRDVLDNIPFVIPFEDRVKIFREFVYRDRDRIYDEEDMFDQRTRATIRRNHVFEDGYTYLNGLGQGLKRPVAISFIDQYGLPEAGIDGGGLFKEFLTSLARQAFDKNYGLFFATKDQLLYPNPQAYAKEEQQLNYYEFLGRILGKALYEGILVEVAFAGFFLSKWLGQWFSHLDDLPSLDPELYQGLLFLKDYNDDVETNLSLNFTVVDNEFGESRTVELISGGTDIPVTNESRFRYVYLMANYRLNEQIKPQCRAFFKGLSDLIKPKWLRMFNQHELQTLISGASVPIDIGDLQKNTVYSGYQANDTVIENFWHVVSHFSEERKRGLVKFVTSCSRPPLLGFKELNPKFSIRNAGSELRLPTSSTCINLLKLPAYPDKQTLKEKLEMAIDADVGFGLS